MKIKRKIKKLGYSKFLEYLKEQKINYGQGNALWWQDAMKLLRKTQIEDIGKTNYRTSPHRNRIDSEWTI